ncbi:hypothetical protein [Paraburkholderia sp. MM5477-R1]|uniref:hypothetical protein n=1 Tax=Paraburkholderia sp. MM5477-R1 TaxID=2991062 RepID=UPI003D253CFC
MPANIMPKIKRDETVLQRAVFLQDAPANASPSESDNKSDFSAYLTGSALLFGAYFYFISWMHLYFYYRELGISLMSLDIPIYYFLVYSYSAINVPSKTTYIIVFLVILFFTILDRRWSWDKKSLVIEIFHRVLLTGFILLVFIFGYMIARGQGLDQAREARRGGLRTVHIVFKKEALTNLPDEIASSDREFAMKYITETKDNLYVLVQPGIHLDPRPIGYTYIIPRKGLAYVKIDLTGHEYVDPNCIVPFFCEEKSEPKAAENAR